MRPDHAQYLALYLDLMKADSKAIFAAAAAAARAVDYLKGLQSQRPEPERPQDAPDERLAASADGPGS